MEETRKTLVDFVARGETPDEYRLVLVETGPWDDELSSVLRRIQDRLYGCLDASLEGDVANKFPGSSGKHIVIELDCYDASKDEAWDFFRRFAAGVLKQPSYAGMLENNSFVTGVSFRTNLDTTGEP